MASKYCRLAADTARGLNAWAPCGATSPKTITFTPCSLDAAMASTAGAAPLKVGTVINARALVRRRIFSRSPRPYCMGTGLNMMPSWRAAMYSAGYSAMFGSWVTRICPRLRPSSMKRSRYWNASCSSSRKLSRRGESPHNCARLGASTTASPEGFVRTAAASRSVMRVSDHPPRLRYSAINSGLEVRTGRLPHRRPTRMFIASSPFAC